MSIFHTHWVYVLESQTHWLILKYSRFKTLLIKASKRQTTSRHWWITKYPWVDRQRGRKLQCEWTARRIETRSITIGCSYVHTMVYRISRYLLNLCNRKEGTADILHKAKQNTRVMIMDLWNVCRVFSPVLSKC